MAVTMDDQPNKAIVKESLKRPTAPAAILNWLHTNIDTQIHTYVRTYVQTNKQTNKQTNNQKCE